MVILTRISSSATSHMSNLTVNKYSSRFKGTKVKIVNGAPKIQVSRVIPSRTSRMPSSYGFNRSSQAPRYVPRYQPIFRPPQQQQPITNSFIANRNNPKVEIVRPFSVYTNKSPQQTPILSSSAIPFKCASQVVSQSSYNPPPPKPVQNVQPMQNSVQTTQPVQSSVQSVQPLRITVQNSQQINGQTMQNDTRRVTSQTLTSSSPALSFLQPSHLATNYQRDEEDSWFETSLRSEQKPKLQSVITKVNNFKPMYDDDDDYEWDRDIANKKKLKSVIYKVENTKEKDKPTVIKEREIRPAVIKEIKAAVIKEIRPTVLKESRAIKGFTHIEPIASSASGVQSNKLRSQRLFSSALESINKQNDSDISAAEANANQKTMKLFSQIAPMKFGENHFFEIRILDVVSPSNFTFQYSFQKLDILMDELNKFYNNSGRYEDFRVKAYDIKVGMVVAVRQSDLDNRWYRAQVKVVERHDIYVSYIDYLTVTKTQHKVSEQDICHLDAAFTSMPPKSAIGRLHGVKPLAKMWSLNSKMKLINETDEIFKATIKKHEDDVYALSIIINSNFTRLIDVMINKKLADVDCDDFKYEISYKSLVS